MHADDLFSQVGIEVLILCGAFEVGKAHHGGTVWQLLYLWLLTGEHIYFRTTLVGHADALNEAVFVWANWVLCCHV